MLGDTVAVILECLTACMTFTKEHIVVSQDAKSRQSATFCVFVSVEEKNFNNI